MTEQISQLFMWKWQWLLRNWSHSCVNYTQIIIAFHQDRTESVKYLSCKWSFKCQIQWGSEYKNSPVFKWLKVVWSPNRLVFKCHLNNELILVWFSDHHLNIGQLNTRQVNFVIPLWASTCLWAKQIGR